MDADAVVTLLTFGLGAAGLARAAWSRVAAWMPVAEYEEASPSYIAPPDYGAALEDDPDAPLTAEEWLRLLNDEADKIPHLFAYGPSGSGKSTFILALLQRRPGRLVICTPKNAQDDPWGGFPAVRLGVTEDGEPDFHPLGDAIEAVYREMNRRNAGTSTDRTPITLVVDEITSIVYELKARDLVAKLIRLWLMGRSVRIRLITMDPTANVKGLGLEGRGDVRESIGWVRCERDKSAMLGELEECRAADGVPLDTADVPRLAAALLDPARVWVPVWDTGMGRANTGNTAHLRGTGIDDTVERLARETDMSANKIYEKVGGNRNDVLRRVGQVRGYRSIQEA